VYAVTSGYDGNSVVTTGQRINPVNSVAGLTTEVISPNPTGGANQPPASILKTVSATSFGTLSAAVTPRQYLATALGYPDIKDVRMYAQREVNTSDVKFMNVIRVVPLFGSANPAPAATKAAFLAYMQERSMFAPVMYIVDPTAVARTISVRLFCYNWATLSACEADARAAITALFTPRAGYLGYNVTISDIIRVAQNSNAGIEYMQVLAPTSDFSVSGEAPAAPSLSSTPGVSTLAQAVNTYMIGVTDPNGIVLPQNVATVQVPAANSYRIDLSWAAYPNALSYQVYGRIGGAIGLLADLPGTQTTYQDAGGAVGATVPLQSTYPSLYNSLASLTVASAYSTRSRAG
jgi:hypothetical protein